MSVQQSINQSILAAGALYSQSGAAEQRKLKAEKKRGEQSEKIEKEQIKSDLKKGIQGLTGDALEEYRDIKANRLKELGSKYGDVEAFRVGFRNTSAYKQKEQKKAAEAQEASENAPPAGYDPEIEDELAQRAERQAVDEYEMAAQKEKDRREKRIMMRQANRAAVQKRIEMLSDRDFRQDILGGN